MKYLALLLLATIVGNVSFAHASSFDDAVKAMDHAFQTQNQLFEQESKDQEQSYLAYEAEINRAWQQYTEEIEAVWGKANSKVPSKKEWVSYSKDRKQRSSIDFEAGKIKLEFQVEGSITSAAIRTELKAQLERLFSEPAQEDQALKVSPPHNLATSHTPKTLPLQNQLAFTNGTIVTKANLKQFSTGIVKQPLEQKVIQTPQGKRQVVSISISLIPAHIEKRARPFLSRVHEMAHRYDIPASLIYGIIQTESYFNPMARSHVPAYGLMQLVPRSGGRDAYEYVFKQDKILSAEYLYNTENNIELGSAYLKLLQIREMRRIHDPKTRMLCAIAAYNTGGGNVAKAFIPESKSIKKASQVINTMSYEQVYNHLRSHLPYEETQRYIVKVRKHMKNFTKLDQL